MRTRTLVFISSFALIILTILAFWEGNLTLRALANIADPPETIANPDLMNAMFGEGPVYVSDLTPTRATEGTLHGKSITHPLSLKGAKSQKGLRVVAPSELHYDLEGQYLAFSSDIGLDDAAGAGGSVIFRIYADDVKVFDSGEMSGRSSIKNVFINLLGKHELKLVVADAGDGNRLDIADWADAKLVRNLAAYRKPSSPSQSLNAITVIPSHSHAGGVATDAHAKYDLELAIKARGNAAFVAPTNLPMAVAPQQLNELGTWGPVRNWPFAFASAANLPDGRILAWGGNFETYFNGGDRTFAAYWNPANDQITSVNNDNHSSFCGIPTMMADGRVFLNGGDGTRERVSIYDYRNNRWTRSDDMQRTRWYPGSVMLPNGQVYTALGDGGDIYPEIWTEGQGWTLLTGVDLRAPILNYPGYQRDWLPYFHLAPNGQIFHSGPTFQMNWLGVTGEGSVADAGLRNSWYQKYGAALMYDEGKLLVTGGQFNDEDQAATNQAMVIDMNGANPTKTIIAPMTSLRKFHNAVPLPNGEVLVIGGTRVGIEFSDQQSVMTPEIWNPGTGQWRTVAAHSIPRNYHALAMLLTDGRVWSGGGGLCGCDADHPDHQVYTPPYLYNANGTLAARPTINAGPDVVVAGETRTVTATAGMVKFTLIKMTGLTHNMNSDLRMLNVPFTANGNQYQLTLNGNVNILTPGFWMLFAVNNQGVPSVAKTIRIETPKKPVFTLPLPGDQNSVVNLAISPALQIRATDANRSQALTYSATGLPQGLSINATGLITGVPTAVGVDTVTITVTDSGGDAATMQFVWTIRDDPTIIVINNPGPQVGEVTMPVNLQIQSHGGVNGLTFTASGLPTGLSINAGSGLITGVPTAANTFNVTVTATDTTGKNKTETFSWLIYPPPIVVNPIVSPPQPVNTSINYTAVVANGVNTRVKWLFGDGTPGTDYSASPNVAHTFAQPGIYIVKLTAIDDRMVEKSVFFAQAVHLPPTANRPGVSMNIVYQTPAGGNPRVWAVNQDNDSVSVFDAVANNKLAEISVGASPRALAVAPDGRIWVTNKRSATVSIISSSTLAVEQTLSFPVGSQPYGIVFSPTGSAAFITFEATGKLLRLDPSTGAVGGSLDLGPKIRHVSITGDGAKLYVSRYVTPLLPGEATATPQVNVGGGEVLAINAQSLALEKTITLRHSNSIDAENSGRGIPNYLGPAVISPDGVNAWAPSKQDNILRGSLRDGRNLTFDSTIRSITSHINLATGEEDYPGRIDHNNAGIASTALYDRFGNYLFIAIEGTREVIVVDPYGKREIFHIPVGFAPQGLALSADGLKLYVHNFLDRSISVVDISKLINEGEDIAPIVTTYSTVANERLTAQVLEGKRLFYDAKSPKLSKDAYISCAACHNDGDQDGRVWDFTGFGEGLRNTIALNGRGGGQGFKHWSGNFDEIQDFEGQLRGLDGALGLMTDADYNTGTRSQPLGDSKAGISADLDALAAYVSSLKTFDMSPFRAADRTLTPEAAAGRLLFINLNCVECHGGKAFTVSGSGNLFDIGTIKPSSGGRLGGPLPGIDSPTLRDVWMTAPYLHDGSAATLGEAVRAHKNVTIGDADLVNMVAYLQQIGSEENIVRETTTRPVTPGRQTPGAPPRILEPSQQTPLTPPTTPSTSSRTSTTTDSNRRLMVSGQKQHISAMTKTSLGNQSPLLSKPVNQTSARNVSASLQLEFNDPDGDPLSFSATELPQGLVIDSKTGLISGTPTASGIYQVTVSATDGQTTQSASFVWKVTAQSGPRKISKSYSHFGESIRTR
jgi:YVTN family beta-propeller protein